MKQEVTSACIDMQNAVLFIEKAISKLVNINEHWTLERAYSEYWLWARGQKGNVYVSVFIISIIFRVQMLKTYFKIQKCLKKI